MKQIEDILKGIQTLKIEQIQHLPVSKICFDTRQVENNCVFVAQKGTKTDGHQFIPQAIAAGARYIVLEDMPNDLQPEICYIQVQNSSLALALMTANFYDHPSQKLKLVGITGTNGKTTTVTLLYRLFCLLGKKTGLLSTIENRINDLVIPSTHTTPDSVKLNELMACLISP